MFRCEFAVNASICLCLSIYLIPAFEIPHMKFLGGLILQWCWTFDLDNKLIYLTQKGDACSNHCCDQACIETSAMRWTPKVPNSGDVLPTQTATVGIWHCLSADEQQSTSVSLWFSCSLFAIIHTESSSKQSDSCCCRTSVSEARHMPTICVSLVYACGCHTVTLNQQTVGQKCKYEQDRPWTLRYATEY